MSFNELKDFIENKMRLSHIYQPLLIKSLIECGGVSTIRQMAITFLSRDESQIVYYEKILKSMPIKVLSNHNVILKDRDLIKLNTKKLTLKQKAEISKLCEEKMQEYIAKRGLSIWDHRLIDGSAISDSLRYEVLKESSGRCSLCGATKKDTVLDVDHIIPRSKGGKTVYENLQVLCAKCNRSKGNKDDTDFRETPSGFEVDCLFCNQKLKDKYVIENDYAFAILDNFPVTKFHTLIIPKRHFTEYFDITDKELIAVNKLVKILKKQLIESDGSIQGFNIGTNCGKVSGQTIDHCHIHLIPRRKGDIDDPRGGIRGVIPDRMNY